MIQQDDEIRLRIVGTRVDAKDIVSTDMSCIAVCLCPCTAQRPGQNSLLLQSGCLTYQHTAQLNMQTFCPIKQVCSYEKRLPAKISLSQSTFFMRDLRGDHYLSVWQVKCVCGNILGVNVFKDVRAHSYCASLVRRLYMTWRVPRHVFQARPPSRNSTKYRADDLCDNLICEYFCWMLGDPT